MVERAADRLAWAAWAAQAGVKVVTEAGLTLARVDTVRQCQCPHPHQAVAVRVTEDKHP